MTVINSRMHRRVMKALTYRRVDQGSDWPPVSVLVDSARGAVDAPHEARTYDVVAGFQTLPEARKWAARWVQLRPGRYAVIARTKATPKPVIALIR